MAVFPYKNGFANGATATNLTNQSRVGFYRNDAKDANDPFGIDIIEH